MTPLEEAVVLLHFGSARAADAVAQLPAYERGLVERVDPRAFRADGERRARAASVIAEELPVTSAILGPTALFAFFDDDAFVDVVRGGAGLVPRAAAWLEERAGGAREMARLEGAIARARRRTRLPPGDGITLAAGVGVCTLAAGTLAAFAAARAQLGPRPHEAVARGARVAAVRARDEAHDGGREHVLIQGEGASLIPTPLFEVLRACEPRAARAAVVARIQQEGATAREAEELLEELLADGLVAHV